ncbi:MAG TPA: hypothetical protein VFS43_02920 [Polyangiaceae bacterium]|nr:hypothetical protein [Polyangiaceae bacterium]
MPIALAPPLDAKRAELSGLAWDGDTLLLLSQYPEHFHGGALFTLSKAAIERWLGGDRSAPLEASTLAFEAPGVADKIEGYQGYEELLVAGDTAYLSLEGKGRDGRMRGYVVRASFDRARAKLRVDAETLIELECPSAHDNIGYEALTAFRGELIAFYEANGPSIVSRPCAFRVDVPAHSKTALTLFPLPYRITGATPADAAGRFWVTNVFWPGEPWLRDGDDPIARRFGKGPTHARSEGVERLVELRVDPAAGVVRTEAPPVSLALRPDGKIRNWEGIARLDDRGFLIVSDEHPTTIFAFVPLERRP